MTTEKPSTDTEYDRGRREGIEDCMDAIEKHDLTLSERQRNLLKNYIDRVLLAKVGK